MPNTTNSARSVLFVVSAADHLTLADGSTKPTGFWAEELIAPHRAFANAGWDIVIATPGGRAPTVDQVSLDSLGELQRAAQEDYLTAIDLELSNPKPLEDIDEQDFDVVFYPGGHGPMEDLAEDDTSAELIVARMAAGRALGLVCHAPAALLALDESQWPFTGFEMTALTDAEEGDEMVAGLKWTVESQLRSRGVKFTATDPFQPQIVVDRNLYTGQNPASSEPLAQRILNDF